MKGQQKALNFWNYTKEMKKVNKQFLLDIPLQNSPDPDLYA